MLHTADGALAIDREQRIILWNEAAEVLLGFKAEEMLGRRCHAVIEGRDESGRLLCHENCPNVIMAEKQEMAPAHEVLIRTKAGREIWVSVSTVLIPSIRGDPCLLVHLFRDISRLKEMQRFVKQLVSGGAKFCLSAGNHSMITPPPSCSSMGHLTGREWEVLRLLASGASTRTIAGKLFISPFTARNHVQKILAKLEVHSRLEAVALASRNGLLWAGATADSGPPSAVPW